MENLWNQLNQAVGADLWLVLKAVGILVVGWLIAVIVAAIVRGALRRTDIDNRIAAWFAGEKSLENIDLEAAIGRLFFILVMLFAVVAAFEALHMTVVTEPLRALLGRVMEYAPRLLSGGMLLGLAWLLATGVRYVVSTAIGASRLGEHVLDEAAGDKKGGPSLGAAIGEALYWFIFLLFLPGILGALALDGMLAPVQAMLGKITSFLPNLFIAGITLAVGWLLARIVQRIVTSFAAAVGVDAFSDRVGLQKALGGQTLSKILGGVVYVFVLIPILISALSALELEAVTTPLSNMLSMILGAIPSVFAATLVLAVSFAVARVVGGLVTNLLTAIGFDSILARIGFGTGTAGSDKTTPASVVGSIVVALIMLFAAMEAANLLGFDSLEGVVDDLLAVAGHVLFGVVIFGVGMYLANFIADSIRGAGAPNANVLATVARVAVMVLAGAVALRQMGLANEIIELAFGLTLGAAAVAAAIAFGIGGREIAAKQLDRWARTLDK
jgi:hypothetical protein